MAKTPAGDYGHRGDCGDRDDRGDRGDHGGRGDCGNRSDRGDRGDYDGRRNCVDRMALVFNRSPEAVSTRLPALGDDRAWLRVLDTARPEAVPVPCGDLRQDIPPESIVAFEIRRRSD